MHDWIQLIIACLVFVVSGIAAVVRVSFAIKDAMATIKAEFHALLELEQERRAKDVARVYERFDDYKTHIESKLLPDFVRKDMCAVMHTGTAAAVNEMKIELKELRREISELKDIVIKRA
jgi:hypothetical protein